MIITILNENPFWKWNIDFYVNVTDWWRFSKCLTNLCLVPCCVAPDNYYRKKSVKFLVNQCCVSNYSAGNIIWNFKILRRPGWYPTFSLQPQLTCQAATKPSSSCFCSTTVAENKSVSWKWKSFPLSMTATTANATDDSKGNDCRTERHNINFSSTFQGERKKAKRKKKCKSFSRFIWFLKKTSKR